MVDAAIGRELSTFMERLPVEQQRQVLAFARNLSQPIPRGVRGSELLKFSGAIDEADLNAMSRAIEAGCNSACGLAEK
jgi:hypothetical protein